MKPGSQHCGATWLDCGRDRANHPNPERISRKKQTRVFMSSAGLGRLLPICDTAGQFIRSTRSGWSRGGLSVCADPDPVLIYCRPTYGLCKCGLLLYQSESKAVLRAKLSLARHGRRTSRSWANTPIKSPSTLQSPWWGTVWLQAIAPYCWER
jgi:hypothetical protein